MRPVFPIENRSQSRGYLASPAVLSGVAASKGFDEPPLGSDKIDTHARAAFRRMDELLAEAGLERGNITFVQVYLHDVLRDIEGFNGVWRNYFEGLSPCRCCVGATLQIFLPYVPVYDKTKKEIVSLSAGKSVDMTDINQGNNIVNYNLTALWEEKTGSKSTDTLE